MKFVRHIKKPGWGVGRVLSEDDVDLLVYFEATGPKKLRKAMALPSLEKVEGSEVGPTDLLRHVKADAQGKYAAPPLTFDDMVQNFLRIEGGGFDHDFYIEDERKYKEKAVALAAASLAPTRLKAALEDGDPTLVFDGYKKVVQATNLLSMFEKAKLSSLPVTMHQRFAEVFVGLHAGEALFDDSFNEMAETFTDLGIGSWPTCTYGLFMMKPNEHLIVKPTFVQRAATALAYEIGYASRPTAPIYKRILGFAQYIRQKLIEREMPPKDMIDVQGFIWLGTGGGDGV